MKYEDLWQCTLICIVKIAFYCIETNVRAARIMQRTIEYDIPAHWMLQQEISSSLHSENQSTACPRYGNTILPADNALKLVGI